MKVGNALSNANQYLSSSAVNLISTGLYRRSSTMDRKLGKKAVQ